MFHLYIICLSMMVETQKAEQVIFILWAAYAMIIINVPVIMELYIV